MLQEAMKYIKQDEFVKLIETNIGFTLIELGSSESGWCVLMQNQINRFLKHCTQDIKYYHINIQKAPLIEQQFQVKLLPKYLLYKNQKLISSFEGLKSVNELNDLLSSYCK